MTQLCKTERLSANESGDLQLAAKIVCRGGIVGFPTETVYGLGANALDETAIARIFEAKQRPAWDPLIVHVCDREMLAQVAEVPEALLARVEQLISTFWPGPLTLLLPRRAVIPEAVTAGRPLVGVRMPAHPVALELIRLAGVPIAAPSANRFGHTSPTTAAHVLADLDGRIDGVLDGGATTVGVESTVLGAMETPMLIYRPGAVTEKMIEDATGCPVEFFQASATSVDSPIEGLPSPGVGLRHYAPRARMHLVEVGKSSAVSYMLQAECERLVSAGEIVGVMLPEGWYAPSGIESFAVGNWGEHTIFAQRLFAGFRELDARGVSVIVCPIPAGEGLAEALRDRIEKAARPR